MIASFSIASASAEETRRIGQAIGQTIEDVSGAGTVIALIGDLGSGKTALVQGLARGLAVPEKYFVTSPSYTLVNEYPGRLHLFHLDLYRLSDADFDDIGLYDILDTRSAVVAIEWAERLGPDIFFEGLTLRIEIVGDNARNIVFTASGDKHVRLLTRIEDRIKENLWH